MENQEEIHEVLTLFEKKPSTDIPAVLEDYLKTVAKTGKTLFPWSRLKSLFISKVEQVMEQFNSDVPFDHMPPFPNVENCKYAEMQRRIVDAMQRFTGAPFTVQRICELVTQPRKHYTRCDKFLRGIEKNVMVVSTVDPSGRKIVSESSRIMVNGLDTNGFSQKQDLNEFTEGQPFSPMLQAGWANNAASMWPTAGMQDHVESLQKLSANVVNETSGANINANGSLAVSAMRENLTNNAEKFEDGRPVTGDGPHTFSTLFQQKPNSEEPSNSNTSLAPLSGVVADSAIIRPIHDSDENESKRVESSEEGVGVESSEARVSGDGEASQGSGNRGAQEVSNSSSEGKEVPPDPIDTEDGGPPEKKMRVEEDSTSDSSKGHEVSPTGKITSQQDTISKSAESEDASTTEASQSSCASRPTDENPTQTSESPVKSVQEADSKDTDAPSEGTIPSLEQEMQSGTNNAASRLDETDHTSPQDKAQQQEVRESSSACTDCDQQPLDSSKDESEVSQSDLSTATSSKTHTTTPTTTATTTPITSSSNTLTPTTTTSQPDQNTDDQSAVSSSEDTDNSSSNKTQQDMDSSDNGAEVDQTDNNSVDESDNQNAADQTQTCNEENNDMTVSSGESSESIQESSSAVEEGNNEVSGSSDSGENMSEVESNVKSADEGQGVAEDETGCSSAGEMMDTDSGTDEKSGTVAEDGDEVQSTMSEEQEQEPMDQE